MRVDLGTILTDRWPYKVAAVVLSVLLWLNVAADQERGDQAVPTRLDIVVADTMWTLREAPPQVTTVFEGRRGDIIALFDQPTIREVITEVADSVMEIELDASRVQFDRDLSVRPTAVTPSRVVVRLEPRVRVRVPVYVNARAEAEQGYVVGDPQVSPDSVTVRGPRSVVSLLSRLETERLDLGQLERTVDRHVPVVLPPGVQRVTLSPPNVLVTIPVDSLMSRRFLVPITAEGPFAGEVTLDPTSVALTVRGGAAVVSRLAALDFQVIAVVGGAFAEPRSVQLRVRPPPGVEVTTTTDPARVTISPPGAGGGAAGGG